MVFSEVSCDSKIILVTLRIPPQESFKGQRERRKIEIEKEEEKGRERERERKEEKEKNNDKIQSLSRLL